MNILKNYYKFINNQVALLLNHHPIYLEIAFQSEYINLMRKLNKDTSIFFDEENLKRKCIPKYSMSYKIDVIK